MRCKDTTEQDRRDCTEPQQIVSGQETKGERHAVGYHAEQETLAPVLVHTAHVHLQCGQEHDEVYPHLAEDLETPVPLYDVEAMLAYHHTGQYQAYDVGRAEAAEQDGRKQDNHQYHKEHPRGVRDQCHRHVYGCQYLKHVLCV